MTHFPQLPSQVQLQHLQQLQQLQQQQPQGQPIAGQALNRQQRLLAPRLPYVPPALPPNYATQPIQQQQLQQLQQLQQPADYSTIPLQTPSQAEPIIAPQTIHVPGDDFASHVHTWSSADQLSYLTLPETTTFQGSHHVAYQPQTMAEAIPPSYQNPDTHPVIVQHDPAVQSMADTIGFYTDDTFQQAQVYYAWDAEQEGKTCLNNFVSSDLAIYVADDWSPYLEPSSPDTDDLFP